MPATRPIVSRGVTHRIDDVIDELIRAKEYAEEIGLRSRKLKAIDNALKALQDVKKVLRVAVMSSLQRTPLNLVDESVSTWRVADLDDMVKTLRDIICRGLTSGEYVGSHLADLADIAKDIRQYVFHRHGLPGGKGEKSPTSPIVAKAFAKRFSRCP